MDQVRKYLKEFGFLDEDINYILETYSIVSFSEETLLKHCIEVNIFFLKNNYSAEEIVKMTKNFPQLYSLSIENIKQKIEYLKEVELDFIVLNDTKQLMQSIDLTYTRYEFLKENDIIVSNDNYRLSLSVN